MKLVVLTVIAIFTLAGCSSTGPVQVSKDTYMISKMSAGGAFVQPGAVRVEIIREGSSFCASQNKVFQLISFNDTFAAPGRMPASDINFMCLKEGDPEIARIKLRKEADTVIEMRK